MKKITKRILAALLAGTMCISMAACSNDGNDSDANSSPSASPSASSPGTDANQPANGKVLADDVTLNLLIGSHASYPYDENWVLWDIVREKVGGKLNITAVNNADMMTKVNLAMASKKDMPDVLHVIGKEYVAAHCLSGAFVNINDNLDLLPNFVAWRDATPDSAEIIKQRTAGDGNFYHFPVYGLQTINNLRTWMYREDVFKANNLEAPKTLDEMYEVAKQLKAIYPDSYPVCFRSGIDQMNVMGSQFKPYFECGFYYDFNAEKWEYGGIDPTMKEVIQYFKKLKDESLVPPNFLTIETADWQELVATDRGFMMPEYIIRIDFFNLPARASGKTDYTWKVMAPPEGPNGDARVKKTNVEISGYLVCNTGNKANMENALRYVDWFYSPEGQETISWGEEGVTFEVKDGKKQFILGDGELARNKYGFGTYGLYQVMDSASNEALYTEENVKNAHEAVTYTMEKANPLLWLPIEEADQITAAALTETINTYSQEQVSAFILGERSLDEWDKYVEEIMAMGIQEVLDIYTNAYDKVK